MIRMIFTTVFLACFIFSAFSQDSIYDAKYDLTICTTTRNADAVLMIKDSTGNLFTGILIWDDIEREVFGWYFQKKSEGGEYIYNTEGMVFYCQLDEGFQYQQLFKGLFNFDKSYLSGNYFFWGNEFIFYGNKADMQTSMKSQKISPVLKIYPNPVGDLLTIESENNNNERIDIYDMTGKLALSSTYKDHIIVSALHSGTYIMVLTDYQGKLEKVRFIKN